MERQRKRKSRSNRRESQLALRNQTSYGILESMAEINLREYDQEIDRLIERNQLDEAIAHARHILQAYPKHLDTYRLLGKSYLEAKRYGDAADIFQRVLSAVPDDFIAHIGMSIVREDEGNLDAALWHMERGFETNPSNPAIQQELRRLISRRDGIEPHKVRLTRGALARMYAQGELYTQAIAELQAALKDDPERPDLEVILCELFWRIDKKVEAAETGQRVLAKLPFCLQANRIIAAVLHEADKIDEAATYHRRLAALNPYAAYVESPMMDPKTVDPDSVKLEKLRWSPGQPLPSGDAGHGRPDWAQSLGIELESEDEAAEETEALSDEAWIDDDIFSVETPIAEPTSTPAAEPIAGPEASLPPAANGDGNEGDIPEWMEDAGWGEDSGQTQDGPVEFSEDEISSIETEETSVEPSSGDAVPADLPDWLQGAAPADAGQTDSEDEDLEKLGLPDWMEEFPEGEEAEEPGGGLAAAGAAAALGAARLHDGEDDQEEEEDATPADEAGDSGDLPTWLDDAEPGATETISSWLGDVEGDEQVAGEGSDASDEAAWLPELANAARESTGKTDELEALRSEIPDTGGLAAAGEISEESPRAESSATPDWLQDIASGPSEGDTGILQSQTDDSGEDDLDWLSGLTDEPQAAQDLVNEPAESEETRQEEAPADIEEPVVEAGDDWLSGIGQEEREDEADDDSLDWLKGIAEEEPDDAALGEIAGLGAIASQEETEAAPSEDIIADDDAVEEPDFGGALDWLQEPASSVSAEPEQPELEAPIEIDAGEIADQPQAPPDDMSGEPEPTDEVTSSTIDEMSEDEVFEWLENLAANQPAEQGGTEGESVPTTPADSSGLQESLGSTFDEEKLPDDAEESLAWLDKLAAERGIDLDVTQTETADSVSMLEQDDKGVETDAPSWLDEPAGPPQDVPAAEDSDVLIPDWLRSKDQESPAIPQEPEDDISVDPAAETIIASVDRDLQGLPEFDEPRDAAPSDIEQAQELDVSGTSDTGIEEPSGLAEDVEDQSMPESALEEGTTPDVAAPEWLREAAEAAETEDSDEEAEAIPEWLREPAVDEGSPVEGEIAESAAPVDKALEEFMASDEEDAGDGGEFSEEFVADEAQPSFEGVETEHDDFGEQIEADELSNEAEPVPDPQSPEQSFESEEATPAVELPQEVEKVPEEPIIAPSMDAEIEPVLEAEGPMVETIEPEAGPAPVVEVEPVPELEPPSEPTPFDHARELLRTGSTMAAVAEYERLMHDDANLDVVIEDLESAVLESEDPAPLWQLLGDAYMKADRIPDAVQAFGRGMQLTEVLSSAREALAEGEYDLASAQYSVLISKKKELNSVIEDLQLALDKDPDEPGLWRVLGDAYMNANRVDEAIDAYQKGIGAV